MKNKLLKKTLPVIPKNLLSRGVGALFSKKLPGPLSAWSTQAFVKLTGIDMSEAEYPLDHYSTIHDVFIRRLKPGARPLGSEPVHPADGEVISGGSIHRGKIDQVKGLSYSLLELIRQTRLSEQFEGGVYQTTYLSPQDYHRVHSPVTGSLFWAKHIPGDLWPVNSLYVQTMPRLFVSNERLVVGIQSELGCALVVFVGATNVGKISLSPDVSWLTNQRSNRVRPREKSYSPGLKIAAGDELGIFHLGSTVVTLFDPYFVEAVKKNQGLKGEVVLGPCRVNSRLLF